MIKNILVCTDGSDYGNVASKYGVHLAGKLHARILGLHVLDSRMLEGPLMADLSGWIGAQPYGDQLSQFRELMESKGEAVIDAFNSACNEAGLKAEGWLKMGHPTKVILEEEAKSELVILGQKGIHAEFIGDLMGSCVEHVVRNSIKPCLVTGSTFTPVTRILAAYDGSNHASQALSEAVELSSALGVGLAILTVAGDDEAKAHETAQDGLKLAVAHDVAAASLVREGKEAEVILQCAEDEGCNFIVLGAHGHSRIREMILGSTTMFVVNNSNLPVMVVR
ncbi:MAG: universal stress protein [Verrucomicrobia bacterium]|nr:universal stress protein [Verrucomicrobiota bacterium]